MLSGFRIPRSQPNSVFEVGNSATWADTEFESVFPTFVPKASFYQPTH